MVNISRSWTISIILTAGNARIYSSLPFHSLALLFFLLFFSRRSPARGCFAVTHRRLMFVDICYCRDCKVTLKADTCAQLKGVFYCKPCHAKKKAQRKNSTPAVHYPLLLHPIPFTFFYLFVCLFS